MFPTPTPENGVQDWAGVAFDHDHKSGNELTLEHGGVLEFTGSVPDGGNVNVRFRFEWNSYPETEPSYNTEEVTVSGTDEETYSVSLPPQGMNTYDNIILYVVTQDIEVVLKDFVIMKTPVKSFVSPIEVMITTTTVVEGQTLSGTAPNSIVKAINNNGLLSLEFGDGTTEDVTMVSDVSSGEFEYFQVMGTTLVGLLLKKELPSEKIFQQSSLILLMVLLRVMIIEEIYLYFLNMNTV